MLIHNQEASLKPPLAGEEGLFHELRQWKTERWMRVRKES